MSLATSNGSGSHTRVLPSLIMVLEPNLNLQLAAGLLGLAILTATRKRRQEGRAAHT